MKSDAIFPGGHVGGALLDVSECVGPTFQGHGPSAGQLAMIIRLSRCNLACVGCDVPHTWDWSRFDPRLHSRRFSVDELASWALGSSAQLVVITGGEPLLQQPQLVPLVRCLANAGRWVEIETNGTCAPEPALTVVTDLFVVSPRLANAGARLVPAQRINPAALEAFVACGQAVFAFAVRDHSELDEIAELEQQFALAPIWVMPAGTAATTVLAELSWLAEAAVPRGWHVSTRLQSLLRGGPASQ